MGIEGNRGEGTVKMIDFAHKPHSIWQWENKMIRINVKEPHLVW
jgi:hypothetical protein